MVKLINLSILINLHRWQFLIKTKTLKIQVMLFRLLGRTSKLSIYCKTLLWLYPNTKTGLELRHLALGLRNKEHSNNPKISELSNLEHYRCSVVDKEPWHAQRPRSRHYSSNNIYSSRKDSMSIRISRSSRCLTTFELTLKKKKTNSFVLLL